MEIGKGKWVKGSDTKNNIFTGLILDEDSNFIKIEDIKHQIRIINKNEIKDMRIIEGGKYGKY